MTVPVLWVRGSVSLANVVLYSPHAFYSHVSDDDAKCNINKTLQLSVLFLSGTPVQGFLSILASKCVFSKLTLSRDHHEKKVLMSTVI